MPRDDPHYDEDDRPGTQEEFTRWERDDQTESEPSIYADTRGTSKDDPFSHRPTCHDCGRPLQPGMDACPNCGTVVSAALAGMSVTAGEDYEYRTDRVIFAIIPARSKSLALLRARGIFKTRSDAPPRNADHDNVDPDDSYDIFDAEDVPTSVSQTWGELPGAIQLNTPDGRALIERVTDVLETPSAGSYVSTEHPHLYGKRGKTLSVGEARDLLDTSAGDDQEYWVVSALAHIRQRTPPENALNLLCHHCNEKTAHVFEGRDGNPPTITSAEHDGEDASGGIPVAHLTTTSEQKGQPVWECFRCRKGRFGPSPSAVALEEVDKNGRLAETDVQPHTPDGAPHLPDDKSHHDVVLERLEESEIPIWNDETSAHPQSE